MAEIRIKDENYYMIQGFMINRLGLKGVPLNVYAIIYGFSQDGENEYTGSLQYLCDFTGGTSKPTIIKALKDLVENEYIIRREEFINGVKFNRYKVNLPLLKNFNGGGKETLMGGSKVSLPNNKISNNNIDNKDIKKVSKGSFDKILSAYTSDEKTLDLLREWLKVRKAKRAAMTDYAIKLNINKLDNIAFESRMSVDEYLGEVICRSWAAFYKINNYERSEKRSEQKPNSTDDFMNKLKSMYESEE